MAFINCTFYSEILDLSVSMNVILPQVCGHESNDVGDNLKFPVLYLLHGLSDNCTSWHRLSSTERYVAKTGLIVVMPEVHRSYYTDMKKGNDYWSFISEELPRIVKNFFPASTEREDTFVAGLSMGGYGAFKLALSYPERFAAAASLSGVLDIVDRVKNEEEFKYDFDLIFGGIEKLQDSPNDLFFLAKELKNKKIKLPLYQCCGTEDFLYRENLNFRDLAVSLGLDLTYEEEPGQHNWPYWDRNIEKVIEWLPIRKTGLTFLE